MKCSLWEFLLPLICPEGAPHPGVPVQLACVVGAECETIFPGMRPRGSWNSHPASWGDFVRILCETFAKAHEARDPTDRPSSGDAALTLHLHLVRGKESHSY